MEDTFQDKLNEEEVDLQVEDLKTVTAVSCDDIEAKKKFESTFRFSFSAFADIPDTDLDILAELIEDEYNDLIEDYCDPLIRRDIKVTSEDRVRVFSPGRRLDHAACVNFEGVFTVKGSCRGCDKDQQILDVIDSRNGRSLEEVISRLSEREPRSGPARRRQRRRLQEEEECFCEEGTIAPRAPTEEEFNIRMGEVIAMNINDFDRLCGLASECNPDMMVATVSRTVVLAFQFSPGTEVTDEVLDELEMAIKESYNIARDDYHSDKCDGHYRQTIDVTIDRSVLQRRMEWEALKGVGSII